MSKKFKSYLQAAIEMGADAVLVNTAIAAAGDPAKMARAFALAVEAAELALTAGTVTVIDRASATSPQNTFDDII